jgi:molybdopterin biosynthesis enzyme MoaB
MRYEKHTDAYVLWPDTSDDQEALEIWLTANYPLVLSPGGTGASQEHLWCSARPKAVSKSELASSRSSR